MSSRADKYARKGSAESSGVGKTAWGKTAEECGKRATWALHILETKKDHTERTEERLHRKLKENERKKRTDKQFSPLLAPPPTYWVVGNVMTHFCNEKT